jgi:hypothetical protein
MKNFIELNKYSFISFKKLNPIIIFLSNTNFLEKFKRIVLPLFFKQAFGGLLTIFSLIILLRYYGAAIAGGWIFWLSISTIPSIFYQPFAQTIVRFLHHNRFNKNQSIISICLGFSLLSYIIASSIILILFFQLSHRGFTYTYLNINSINFFHIFLLFQVKSTFELLTYFCTQIYIARKEVLRTQTLLSMKRLVEFLSLIFCVFFFRENFQKSLVTLSILLCISELFFSFKFSCKILLNNSLFTTFKFSISKSNKLILKKYALPSFFISIISAIRNKLGLFYLGLNESWDATAILSTFQGFLNLLNKAQANMLYNLVPFLIQKKQLSRILNKYIYIIISSYYGVFGFLFFLAQGILFTLLKLKYDAFNYDLLFLLCFNFVLYGFLQARTYKLTLIGNQTMGIYFTLARMITYCILFYFFHADLREIFICEVIASTVNVLLVYFERKISNKDMYNTLKITIFFLTMLVLAYLIIKHVLFG